MRLSAYLTFTPLIIATSYIRALRHDAIPTPRAASLPHKRCHIHGGQASQLRSNMTSAVYARILTHAHAGATCRRGAGDVAVCEMYFCEQKQEGLAGTQRLTLTMKMMTGAEVYRRRGARRQN
jgi:hypothetical protein